MLILYKAMDNYHDITENISLEICRHFFHGISYMPLTRSYILVVIAVLKPSKMFDRVLNMCLHSPSECCKFCLCNGKNAATQRTRYGNETHIQNVVKHL